MASNKPTWRDGMKGAMRSMGSGKSKNPWAVSREIKAAQADREANQLRGRSFPQAIGKQWYTMYHDADGTIHAMVDKNGHPTTGYPHVHIIWDERKGEIRMHNTLGANMHFNHRTLPGSSSDLQVQTMARKLRDLL